MKVIVFTLFLLQPFIFISAQNPGATGQAGKGGMKQMNIGHFYGKVIDAKTGKGVEFATLQLFQSRMDTAKHSIKRSLAGGALTEANGDFSIENVSVAGEFILKVTAIGYDSLEQKVSFNVKGAQGNMQQLMAAADKDLGNIKLLQSAILLTGVTVTDDEPIYKMELDKKVYTPDKDPTNTGGTAEDVLKKVPSVNVDIDGNVTLRSAAPQIFVDGRPTTLTIDQIPSDAIEKIEVITNPSAKYDASGGQSGIINIVLKKNRRIGYNGSVRLGADMRGGLNTGGDINLRQGKINVFGSGNFNHRKSIGYGETERYNFYSYPYSNQFQTDSIASSGYFGFGTLGLDYFWNNRNTVTLSGTFNRGTFNPVDDIFMQTDTLLDPGTSSSYYVRNTDNERNFKNLGGALLYKHIFPEEGRQWTADLNYNRSSSNTEGLYTTQFSNADFVPFGSIELQQQIGKGSNEFITAQTDYTDPLSETMKMEAGLRGAVRNYVTENHNYVFDSVTQAYVEIPDLNNYTYTDQVYAAYSTFSATVDKFQYQVGLRLESSFYEGKLTDTEQEFSNNYPISLFPSGFVSYSISDHHDLQASYSRRIDRPTFFQLVPFTDYSDTLNLQRGNPDLKPQFTNTLELSYQYNIDRTNSVNATLYFKNTDNLITRYQVLDYDSVLNEQVIINTYENANSSSTYGLELTASNSIKSWLSLTSSLNFFNVIIDGNNIESGLTNQQFSWLAKINASFKLPANFTFQVNGDYQSKTAVPQNSGGGGGGGRGMGGGGGGWFGVPPATVQGYVNPVYSVDLALKKEFLKNKAAAVTLSFSDIFRSKKYESVYETDFFNQTSLRQRDPQLLRLTFSLKFGKFDTSLFKRKNMKNNGDSIPDIQGM
jgi:outer membrane receptor protein involved in Fe transport